MVRCQISFVLFICSSKGSTSSISLRSVLIFLKQEYYIIFNIYHGTPDATILHWFFSYLRYCNKVLALKLQAWNPDERYRFKLMVF